MNEPFGFTLYSGIGAPTNLLERSRAPGHSVSDLYFSAAVPLEGPEVLVKPAARPCPLPGTGRNSEKLEVLRDDWAGQAAGWCPFRTVG